MAEYIEREALITLIDDKQTEGYELCMPMELKSHYVAGLQKAKQFVERAPAADVVEVVRCKDCKYCEVDCRCTFDGDRWHSPDYFCSCGERKEGAEE